MNGKEKKLNQERLKTFLNYDPETGVFTRNIRTARCTQVGDVVGSITNNGYLCVGIDRNYYQLHRLAWLYIHGEWPTFIDHINGNRADNRIINLRESSKAENAQNRRAAKCNNSTGFLGVSFHKRTGKYRAKIDVGGCQKWLGLFVTAKEAHEAYVAAKRELHPFGVL